MINKLLLSLIFRYMCSFGLHDEIITDPGTMFMSDAVAQLNAWLGIRHKVSLVDVHESNGVERTNAEIITTPTFAL
jgi:hypothetical protein